VSVAPKRGMTIPPRSRPDARVSASSQLSADGASRPQGRRARHRVRSGPPDQTGSAWTSATISSTVERGAA
jgi:hypothetical protein